MIHVFVTRDHAYTIEHYLETWGRELRGTIKPLYYEELAFGPTLSPGAYVFTDLERLPPPQMERAAIVWRTLSARSPDFRLLNDPSKLLRRFELLCALRAAGVNRFRACRVKELPNDLRFPVFIRRASEHDGAISPLLQSRDRLDRALADAKSQRDDLLVVEHCDTADAAGIYRKYSAFRVGERIIARHLFHSRKWMLKKADLVDDAFVEEELRYLRENPHEPELRRIFELAHIDYGRIDYALLDGKIQAWEINTNPTITVAPNRTAPPRLLGQGLFAAAFGDAIAAIDHTPTNRASMSIPLNGAPIHRRAARAAAKALRRIASIIDP
jgi:hypothetical protein